MEVENCLQLASLTEEWMATKKIKGEYDFKNLQLSISNLKWLDVICVSDPSEQSTCGMFSWSVSKCQNTPSLGILTTVKTEPECTVRPRRGIIKHGNKDFDTKVNFSFEGLPHYISKYLSIRSMIVDLGSEVPTVSGPGPTPCHSFKLVGPDEVSQNLGARVSMVSGRYIVFFSLRAALNGDVKVTEEDGTLLQENIMELVHSLPNSERRNRISLTPVGCEWRVSGECEFNFECQSIIESINQ